MTELQIKLRECPIGEPFSRMDCVIAPAVVEDLARDIGQQWIGTGAWMVCVKVEAYIIKAATTPTAESKPTTIKPIALAQHDHAQKTSKPIQNATTSTAKPIAKSQQPAQPKARTAGEAMLALRLALPNVGDRVPLREIVNAGSTGGDGQAAWQACYQMDGIRTPFAYRAPATHRGPERFAHMERVRPDDEPGRTVAGKRGVLLVTQAPQHQPQPDLKSTDNRQPSTPPVLDRVARIQQERALRIAREGTDEPVKGMQLSDGRKPPPPPVKASRADDDDDLPAGVNPGMGDVSRTLNRLKELMPRIGDTILLIDHFPAAVERMNARQICRTDRRFKMTNAGQTARRVEA